jgi:CDP-diacylglycerol--glycerol-3-phosphate 3-phosphatidyltransferase
MLSSILLSDRAPWRKCRDRPKDPVRVALYQTPMLNQVLKMVLPARVQEIVGVCHLKAFVFDDTVIMTGANLSTSYFTVRQDRYLCFPDCKNLASHFCSLINTVALYSYTLNDTGRLQPRSAHLDPVREPELFCTELSDSVNDLTTPVKGAHAVEGADTWVFPTVQMGPLGIRQDEAAMLWLLKQLPGCSDLHLSSPYFNLTPEYETAMLEAARDKRVHILTASPQVLIVNSLLS